VNNQFFYNQYGDYGLDYYYPSNQNFHQCKVGGYLHNNEHYSGDLRIEVEDPFFYLEPDKQIFSKATIDENFTDNAVIIVLNRASSRDRRIFTELDFSDIGALYVKDLDKLSDKEFGYAQNLWEAEKRMALAELTKTTASNEMLQEIHQTYIDIREEAEANTLVNFDQYRRVLLVRLNQNSKENVLNAIRKLQNREYIHLAEPNFIFEPESIIPNDHYFQLPTSNQGYQWSVNNLSLPQAWGITTGSPTIRVGIVGHGLTKGIQS